MCASPLTVVPWERSVRRQAFAEALGSPQKQAEEAAHRAGRSTRRDKPKLQQTSVEQHSLPFNFFCVLNSCTAARAQAAEAGLALSRAGPQAASGRGMTQASCQAQ